jgi:glycerol kinase
MLPELRPCAADFGVADAALLGAPVAIAGVAGDQQAALIGQAGMRAGRAKNTYGTGSFLMLNTGETIVRSSNGLIATVAFSSAPGRASYALEGSVFVTGSAVQWLRDGLHVVDAPEQVEQMAASVADSDGVYFVPAFAGLGAPYWDPHARGTIVGLHRGTTAAHVCRATLEAIAFQSADVVRAMEHDCGFGLSELRVDGGASVNNLLMQLQADVLGVPIVRPALTETTALGAAFCAGLQVGYWSDADEIEEVWSQERRFVPQIDADARAARAAQWHRAVERSRAWAQP